MIFAPFFFYAQRADDVMMLTRRFVFAAFAAFHYFDATFDVFAPRHIADFAFALFRFFDFRHADADFFFSLSCAVFAARCRFRRFSPAIF